MMSVFEAERRTGYAPCPYCGVAYRPAEGPHGCSMRGIFQAIRQGPVGGVPPDGSSLIAWHRYISDSLHGAHAIRGIGDPQEGEKCRERLLEAAALCVAAVQAVEREYGLAPAEGAAAVPAPLCECGHPESKHLDDHCLYSTAEWGCPCAAYTPAREGQDAA